MTRLCRPPQSARPRRAPSRSPGPRCRTGVPPTSSSFVWTGSRCTGPRPGTHGLDLRFGSIFAVDKRRLRPPLSSLLETKLMVLRSSDMHAGLVQLLGQFQAIARGAEAAALDDLKHHLLHRPSYRSGSHDPRRGAAFEGAFHLHDVARASRTYNAEEKVGQRSGFAFTLFLVKRLQLWFLRRTRLGRPDALCRNVSSLLGDHAVLCCWRGRFWARFRGCFRGAQ